ncbi:MAG: acetyl-CoA carboxylase carboxyltransferase subunit beta [Chlorobium limicola]|jgi:acetyl-CoA carboxylase carboxyl transferase subunit beta|uniref:Acetyl-coenzyme A carboxylase carboxyl transferase subunit beta n=1 Tax=Chlorobium limicola (strain DSM 245 / NBRC 103803 / 6330) TaxID=290315 RepID=ACCD_CHLL2|nr:acetyl-CoA carboxylase, carboxyltransferase subunit beta [Chlorobium limicola]B3EFW3.1 RecName: Full=Acetyl-coenzyme A carboxylase carboxyl transferase subunit beta; Short=ACCase subunit beta; Short=Acetyl-CoA carboxylase carboxyltransferase subunit beta [Chlorobium limicola DSM 245]ACD89496.1 acetyl-CoA carboxylase, carboxyl transferase, beta subunit [Chlorobium limicola DSM 245]NTV07940.1 acetyl-CoA carboxylase carboxyltransferase subunit beta [Chlorobium limicola]NTV21417.1 acetyl-CoA car
MVWFKRVKPSIRTTDKRDVPEGLWWKCEECGAMIHKKQLEDHVYTCSDCGYHFRISPYRYFSILFDNDTYQEFDDALRAGDPLGFTDTKKYSDRVHDTIGKSGKTEACRNAWGEVGGNPLVVSAMDFGFIGGSMGSVVGEKISRAVDKAVELNAPLLVISQSGGARMMEGAFSLMQMAKTSARLTLLSEKRLPFFSLMTDPTMGGITASFAMLGDVNLSEPKALIGFAGPRVIRDTIKRDLPEGFQRAEFLHEQGFVDCIVHRKELKSQIVRLAGMLKV